MYQQQNAEVAGGVLAIRADVAPGGGYVSARLASAAGRSFAPGPGETLRIEARIQLPRGDQQSSFRHMLQVQWQKLQTTLVHACLRGFLAKTFDTNIQ